jgi:hypothetical protein
MRVHAAILAIVVALLLATVAALDALGRVSPQAGTVWMLRFAPAGAALDDLPAAADARLLDVFAGGRVLRVHVRSLRATGAGGPWMLRLPIRDLGWPACG